ncbi:MULTISPECIES: pyrroloquinoline quinone biosynthesis peptide chaperone PqqD [Lysobacter]|uniref:pyrroloquinoline quinone biosynthesis peptide chaperone PqqD n=1 Tax=Lysobacter TaxID=68 RepID=UPI001F1AFD81|nr:MULTISPECIES: pyrroloquinoline quinone biosynthesis peptide chaperone PqqD [Lysobacter]UJB18753.1 pyrroloquinoline quinone biosynthesis peptide chaperone PqqD [Lysobacter capsici]UJQ27522.1 pyrroloquinoline quinone biosynthesis peptide chaperone PqqD [Lysobacter gummosus]
MATLTPSSVLRLASGVRLCRDVVRGQWVLLVPERVIELDDIAYEVLARLDGQGDINSLVALLSRDFQADPSQISDDVMELLDVLHGKQLLCK